MNATGSSPYPPAAALDPRARAAFLGQVSTVLASSLDYEVTLARVVRLTIPSFADWCALDLEQGGDLRRVAAAHVDPDREPLLFQLARRAAELCARIVMGTGRAELHAEIGDAELLAIATDDEHLRLLRAVDPRSGICVPLEVRGRVLGALTLVMSVSGRRFDAEDLAMASDLGRVAAQAIDNARLFTEAEEARRRAEKSADRLARLHAVGEALADARTEAQVARAAVESIVSAVTADAGTLALCDERGLIAFPFSRGYTDEQIDGFARLSVEDPVPLAEAIRGARPVWITGVAAWRERYPQAAEHVQADRHAWAAIPLVIDGKAFGAVGLSFGEERAFEDDERLFLSAVARQCAHALHRVRLLEAERSAHAADVRSQIEARRRVEAAQEALGRAEERLRFALDGAQLGMWQSDAPFDKLRPDRRASEHFGLGDGQEITAADLRALVHPDDRDLVDGAFLRAVGEGAEFDVIYRTIVPEGERRSRYVRAMGRAFLDESGRPARFDGITIDVSNLQRTDAERQALFERERAAREEAQRSFERAREADRRKDEFLAMLGHELRNPLAPIQTALQLMRLRGDESLERERTVIERQVRHVVRLVDDLLDVSRITRGKVELKTEDLELCDVVAKAIEMASPLLEEREHDLVVDLPRAGLPVHGDHVRLAQVVANLLNNAGKYTDPGGHIRLSAAREGDEAVLRIQDDGHGIAPELAPRLFDLFVQGERSIDRSQGGLGLGLTIVRSLVELHGGSVTARSEGPGRGSEFMVRLPLAHVPSRARRPRMSGWHTPVAPARDAGRRVLIVDDNRDAADLLGEALTALGHTTHVVYDGPSALDAAAAFDPDVALLDIGLPVMDGYELATRLRARYHDLELVAVTGYGQESDHAQSSAAGFDEHLVKPINIERVAALIDALPRR